MRQNGEELEEVESSIRFFLEGCGRKVSHRMSEREEMVDSLKYLRERKYFLTDVKLRVLKRNVATAIWLRVMVVELLRKETTQGKRCDNRSSIKVRGNKNILERMEERRSTRNIRKKQGAGSKLSYPAPFGRLLRPA